VKKVMLSFADNIDHLSLMCGVAREVFSIVHCAFELPSTTASLTRCTELLAFCLE
jgi:hypothetical protein